MVGCRTFVSESPLLEDNDHHHYNTLCDQNTWFSVNSQHTGTLAYGAMIGGANYAFSAGAVAAFWVRMFVSLVWKQPDVGTNEMLDDGVPNKAGLATNSTVGEYQRPTAWHGNIKAFLSQVSPSKPRNPTPPRVPAVTSTKPKK